MTVKRGLGRGLGALLGEERPVAPREGYSSVPVDAVRANPQQPRKTFDAEGLEELAQSIRELGVLVPVIVRPLPGDGPIQYELIAGERRWRAATAAGLGVIPAIIRSADDRSSLELAVVENLQRQDLDPLEEAMGFAHLIDEYGFTQERLAERIGKSRPAVANALRLLSLPDAIKARLRSGALSVGHARALLAVDGDLREEIASRIESEGLTVRDIERLGMTRRPRKPAPSPAPAPGPAPARKAPDLENVESRLRYRLGTAVTLAPAVRGGRIEIRYADSDDLTRLVDLLLREDS